MPEERLVYLLKPLDDFVDNIEAAVHQAIDSLPELLPPAPKRVLFKADHETLFEALAADAIEHIPIVGPVLEGMGNFFRIRDAARKGEANTATRQLIDALLPLPTNTRRYVKKSLLKPLD